MEIGKKLQTARNQAGFTQEQIAEKINVSRQTISNWENEKSYPDILSIIQLSDIYALSLDELLKGDSQMIEHLVESSDVVKSNKKLIAAIVGNGLFLITFFILGTLLNNNLIFLLVAFVLAIISTTALFYQIIKKI